MIRSPTSASSWIRSRTRCWFSQRCSGLRLVAVDNGRVIAAAWSGKIKTASTMVGIMLMMAFGIPMKLEWLNIAVSIVIAVTTLYSGAEYFIKNKDVLSFK